MDSMAPDFKKIIEPEYSRPKIKVDSVLSTQAVVRTPVLLGHKVQSHEVTTTNPVTGQ